MAKSTDEIDYWDRKGGYGVELHEHNENFSLQEGHDYEGSWYPHWVFTSKWENGAGVPDTSKKSQPNGVYFGDRQSAIEALEYFLSVLRPQTGDNEYPVDGNDPGPAGTNPGEVNEDSEEIPF